YAGFKAEFPETPPGSDTSSPAAEAYVMCRASPGAAQQLRYRVVPSRSARARLPTPWRVPPATGPVAALPGGLPGGLLATRPLSTVASIPARVRLPLWTATCYLLRLKVQRVSRGVVVYA